MVANLTILVVKLSVATSMTGCGALAIARVSSIWNGITVDSPPPELSDAAMRRSLPPAQ